MGLLCVRVEPIFVLCERGAGFLRSFCLCALRIATYVRTVFLVGKAFDDDAL